MAAARKPRAPRVRKAAAAPYAIKNGVGAADSDILVGTIADANTNRLPNHELYWYAYEKHPWIRSCVRLIANSVAQEGFTVATQDGADFSSQRDNEDPRVKEIGTFFRYAFNGKSFRYMLKCLTVDLEVFGVGYWLKRKQGDLLWYERLDPRTITPKLNDDRTAIEVYKQKKSAVDTAGIVVDATSSKDIPAKDMIRFVLEGGDTVLGGPSPLEALDLTMALDLNIRKHRNSYFINGAVGGTYILLPKANEEQAKAYQKQLNATKIGVRNAYSTFVIAGEGATVQKFMESGKNDVDFRQGTEITRDEICAVYSVPPGKLLFSDGALGSSGKNQDDDTFQRDCVLPIEELIYETLTSEILLKEFGIDDLVLVPRRRNAVRLDRFDAALKLVQFGGTGNQALDLVGLPTQPDPAMDKPLFIMHTGATVGDDEAGSTDAPPPEQQGKIDVANDAQDTENEVRSKAARRFRY
jgi:hypothetical protein